MEIGQLVYHPCSVDIMEHKVTSIHDFGNFTLIHTKATHNVGACGKIECVLDYRKGRLLFVELIDEEYLEYSSGLQDFVEGEYYTSKDDARKAFYTVQRTLAWKNMDNKERLYKEAVKRYEQMERILKDLK
jgi:hypothetical protein